jgi:peptide/nickel transport system permease protein
VALSRTGRVARRLRRTGLQAIPSVLGIVIFNFLLLQLAPGDAADVIAGASGAATAETMAALRAQLGLDHSMLHQLGAYLWNLAHLRLGISAHFNMPVGVLILQRLPNTLLLMITALLLALTFGIAAGAVMATFAGRWADRLLSILALLFYSVPGFWAGLTLIIIFSVRLQWLPSDGFTTVGADLTGIAYARDLLAHLVMPAVSLSLFFLAIYARLTRAAMLEVARQDFVRTAEAKGLSAFTVTVRHILRNALVPVSTVAGLHIGMLMGGSIVTETVFGWPGLGSLAYEAVFARDFNLLLAIVLLSAIVVIIANVLIDLLHTWLDPRVEAI